MFKRLDRKNISTSTQVKTSVQRALKSQLLEKHPHITEEQLDALLPKKSPLVQYKLGSYTMIYCQRMDPSESMNHGATTDSSHEHTSSDGPTSTTPRDVPILYQDRDGPIMPTLKLVHQYPTLEFARVTVDQGAIPFLLGGANVMSPGLTNPGGEMPPDDADGEGGKPGLSKGDGVVIFAEGKEYAIGVGLMLMNSAEMYVALNVFWGFWRSIVCEVRQWLVLDETGSHQSLCHLSRCWLLFCVFWNFSRATKKGVAIELLHYLGDGLFETDEI